MRRAISTLSAIAVVAVLPMVATPAQAAPETLQPADQPEQPTRTDNRSHPLDVRRTSLRQRAVDELLSGTASLKGRGKNRTIQMADGVEVDYPVSQRANLLTFLVEFDDTGPLHNQIAEPGPDDNSTYWKSDFDREHYLDMFFNGMPEQGDESFKDLYREMSSGRFDLEGDVSDWVTVPEGEASYGVNVDVNGESNANMTRFISDAADAWIANELADKTEVEVQDYLAQYDVWDRYDSDGDGDFNEPDGYIDHFQAVHAGEGEEAQNPGENPWMIWSHRWAANLAQLGMVGPTGCDACAPWGGVEIGDTGYWIFDYTTEPENGGLGVFAHEFGHDLGLPDYYDTAGGENSNGFWTLMDSGSWLGHGDGSTGGSAGHMGATEKLFLGWYGAETPDGFADLAMVDGLAAEPEEITLGPSYHATTIGKQAVAVTLPDGQGTASGPLSGDYLYSGARDATAVQATTKAPIAVPGGDPTLRARVAYLIETDHDYAYLEVSTNGGATWEHVETSVSTSTDPNGANLGHGITGSSVGNTWQDITADLSAYQGQEVLLRWEYVTDPATHGPGFLVDSLSLGSYSTNFGAATDWDLTGFHSVVGGEYGFEFPHYYLAENRTFDGYDVTLGQGPYSHDYGVTAPGVKVDHYPYEDGLLVWYANGAYGDNNTSEHPGLGANLLVDANPDTMVWSGTGASSVAGGRLQAFDAAFDVDETGALSLTREVAGGSQSVARPARPSVPVFEDTDVDAYWSTQAGGWFSTKVAGAGTTLQVLSSNETTGEMVIKVGANFIAQVAEPTITRPAVVGTELTVDPGWFQDVTNHVNWLRDGEEIENAGHDETYVAQTEDIGHEITAEITGAKDGYNSVNTAVTAGPTVGEGPSVVGTAQVGRTLTAEGGDWPEDGATTFSWIVDGTEVGTGQTYKVEPGDLGKAVTLVETFEAIGGEHGTASVDSDPVVLGDAPVATSDPVIAQTPQVGATLTVTGATWPVPGRSTFLWTIDGQAVGNGSAYVVKPADLAKKVQVEETFASTGYANASSTIESGPVVIGAAPSASAPPSIDGKAMVGATLTVTGANWPRAGTSAYTWTVGGKTVGTGASYQPKPADAGKQVTATETFTAAGYAIATASVTSGKVAKAKVSLKVSHGKARKGKKVSATIRATSPDLKVPGKVKLTYAGKKLKAAKLKKGKVTVKLPAHRAGRYKLKVTYPGATGFGQAKKTVRIKVK